MLLAELKVYFHEEHVRAGFVKKRLKRCYCDGQNNDPEVNQPSMPLVIRASPVI
jgi:hypothetical protein